MDHKLLPKHGEAFCVPLDKANKQGAYIIKLQQEASMKLAELLLRGAANSKDVRFPCKQCVLDVALQFHDLSEALKELAESK